MTYNKIDPCPKKQKHRCRSEAYAIDAALLICDMIPAFERCLEASKARLLTSPQRELPRRMRLHHVNLGIFWALGAATVRHPRVFYKQKLLKFTTYLLEVISSNHPGEVLGFKHFAPLSGGILRFEAENSMRSAKARRAPGKCPCFWQRDGFIRNQKHFVFRLDWSLPVYKRDKNIQKHRKTLQPVGLQKSIFPANKNSRRPPSPEKKNDRGSKFIPAPGPKDHLFSFISISLVFWGTLFVSHIHIAGKKTLRFCRSKQVTNLI